MRFLLIIIQLIHFQILGLTRSFFVLVISQSQAFPPVPRRLAPKKHLGKQSLKLRVRVRGVSVNLAEEFMKMSLSCARMRTHSLHGESILASGVIRLDHFKKTRVMIGRWDGRTRVDMQKIQTCG